MSSKKSRNPKSYALNTEKKFSKAEKLFDLSQFIFYFNKFTMYHFSSSD